MSKNKYNTNKYNTNKYDANSIKYLSDLDHVRCRPAMYIGSTDSKGYHQLFWEILDNAIDEHINGYGDEIDIIIDKDLRGFKIRDYGRGIPVEDHPETGESTLISVFTKLGCGAKF